MNEEHFLTSGVIWPPSYPLRNTAASQPATCVKVPMGLGRAADPDGYARHEVRGCFELERIKVVRRRLLDPIASLFD